jgi:dTDP-4-dehydrorhamnose reductase
MNILVTGANGQLGSEIRNVSNEYEQFKFFFRNSQELDICKLDSLIEFVSRNKIDTIINCAAYTAVDKAEEEPEIARNVNVGGVENLVKVMVAVHGKLIHFSTDYVFDGDHFMPYQENDTASPIGVYGKTKRDGELAVLNSNVDGIVIRTSWLYSTFGNNFVKTILKLGKEKSKLNIVSDQIGTPTFAGNLAIASLDILSKRHTRIDNNGKIYHYSNEGVASWYDFAVEILKIGNIDCQVFPIETKDHPTLAKRPHYSVLNKAKIKNDFGLEIPYWRDSLVKCIGKLNSN